MLVVVHLQLSLGFPLFPCSPLGTGKDGKNPSKWFAITNRHFSSRFAQLLASTASHCPGASPASPSPASDLGTKGQEEQRGSRGGTSLTEDHSALSLLWSWTSAAIP